MNFIDRITFDDLIGNHAVQGWIVPNRKEIVLEIEKKVTVNAMDDLVVLRDKLSAVIKRFAEVTGTGFE